MKMDDIYKLKYLAGITDRDGNKVKEDNGGSNISITGSERDAFSVKRTYSLEQMSGLNIGFQNLI